MKFKRDSSWQMLAPGVYLDPGGAMHVFPDEICAHLNVAYNKENYDILQKAIREIIPHGVPIIEADHDREKN